MSKDAWPTAAAKAIAETAPLAAAVEESAIVRPQADPHAAAVTALLVADYLGQPDVRAKLAQAGVTAADVSALGQLARAILGVVERLGGEYLPDQKSIPGDLVQRGFAVRTAITTALEKALPDDADVCMWLEAIRLGSGVVDLVYDLRSLAELCGRHARANAEAKATAVASRSALAAADAIEHALRSGDSQEEHGARDLLARLWTLFLPAYQKAAAAGLVITRGEGRERQFPHLALVASHRRARQRPLSLFPGAIPSHSAAPAAAPRAGGGPLLSLPPEELEDTDVIRSDVPPAPDGRPGKAPSLPPSSTRPSGDRKSWSDTRGAKRQTVEIEVGIASQSNLYIGFTENLSEGGVFVATYALKPLGEKVEIALAFASGDELRVPGVVCWIRDATPDAWPGMGVRFESLSADDEKKIRKFLSLRDPLFYDE